MKRYFLGSLGLFAILGLVWWGFGNVPSFAGGLKSTTFQVRGVTCGSCLSAIRGELFKKPGMVGMAADLEQGILRVDHRSPLSEEAIVLALDDLGYPAEIATEPAALPGDAPMTRGCSGCGPNGCSATASSWRELSRKIFGGKNP